MSPRGRPKGESEKPRIRRTPLADCNFIRKLTVGAVLDIRDKNMSVRKLAKKYNVSIGAIQQVQNGVSYVWVE